MKKFIWGAYLSTPQIFIKTLSHYYHPHPFRFIQPNVDFINGKAENFYKILPLLAAHVTQVTYVFFYRNLPLSNFSLRSGTTTSLSKVFLKKFKFFKNFLLKTAESPLRKKFFYKFRRYEYVWENHIARPRRRFKATNNYKSNYNPNFKIFFKFKFFNIWKTFHNKTFKIFFKKKINILNTINHKYTRRKRLKNSVAFSYLVYLRSREISRFSLTTYCFVTLYYTGINIYNLFRFDLKHTYWKNYTVFKTHYNEFFPYEASFSNFTKYYYAFHLTKTFSKSFHNYWSEEFYSELLSAYTQINFESVTISQLPKELIQMVGHRIKSRIPIYTQFFKAYPPKVAEDPIKALSNPREKIKKLRYLHIFFPQKDKYKFWSKSILTSVTYTTSFFKHLPSPLMIINFPKLDIYLYSKIKKKILKSTKLKAKKYYLTRKSLWVNIFSTRNLYLSPNYSTKLTFENFKKIFDIYTPIKFLTLPDLSELNLITIFQFNAVVTPYWGWQFPLSIKSFLVNSPYIPNKTVFFEFSNITKSVKNLFPNFFRRRCTLFLNQRIFKKRHFYDFKRDVLPALRHTKHKQISWNKFITALVTSDEVTFFSNFFFNFNKNFFYNANHLNSIHLNLDFEAFTDLLEPYLDNQNIFLNRSITSNFSTIFQKNWYLSNYNPIYNLPLTFKKNLYKYENFSRTPSNPRYLQAFINGFISFWSSLKSLFVLQTNFSNIDESFTNELIGLSAENMNYFTNIHVKFFKKFPVSKFIEFFTFSVFKKDLNYFVKFFKLFVEEMSLKEHKRVFYAFEFLLKKFLYKTLSLTNTYGIKFEVAGKISVTGNSKTRNKIIKLGYYSLTHKKLKIDYLFDVIRTSTGVLGFRIFITY